MPPPATLLLGKRSGTHCTRGWVVLKASQDGQKKPHPHHSSYPGPSTQHRVAILTMLSPCLGRYKGKCLKIWHVSIFYRPKSCKRHIFTNFLSNFIFNSHNISYITLKWKWLFMFLVVDAQMYVAPLFGFSLERNSKYALPLNLWCCYKTSSSTEAPGHLHHSPVLKGDIVLWG